MTNRKLTQADDAEIAAARRMHRMTSPKKLTVRFRVTEVTLRLAEKRHVERSRNKPSKNET